MKLILAELEKWKSPFVLFVLMQEDDFMDNWSLLLCADGLTNSREDFRYVVDVINRYLSREESARIFRTLILPKDDYLVKLFLRYKPDQKIENEQVNGFSVHQAYILASRA